MLTAPKSSDEDEASRKCCALETTSMIDQPLSRRKLAPTLNNRKGASELFKKGDCRRRAIDLGMYEIAAPER